MMTDTNTMGPAYFGKMTASMSHELKNCLAIMNENNGLIQDFTALAHKGRPLDPERMAQVAKRISKQINRADGLLKQMNRFSHSADKPAEQVDLNDATALAASLGARLAANRQVAITVEAAASPVSLVLPFFHLLNLIWQITETLMSQMAPKTVLTINIFNENKAACMAFDAPGPFTEPVEPALEKADVYHLCTGAGAQLEILPDKGRIVLVFGE